mmetsp:Transcript_316/g.875  ORF Transcript_316/g.875 Transcript_316/m.875 type:complete len:327 (+) Transcript_316:92-1072(+)
MFPLCLAFVAAAAAAKEEFTNGGTCRDVACGASMLQVRSSTVNGYVNVAAFSEEEAEAVDMALLQNAAYKGSDVVGWEKLAGFDAVQVYAREGVCVVAFHGTDEAADWADNILIVGNVKDVCGSSIHRGFWREAAIVLGNPAWEENVMPVLTGTDCTSIYAIGHSMGGAVASILAACANHGELSAIHPNATTAMSVSKLYTYAAPAVSSTGFINPLSSDGCWGGARYFIVDDWSFDPVPPVAVPFGFVHPHVQPVQIGMHEGALESIDWPCNSHDAEVQPRDLMRNVSLGRLGFISVPKAPSIAAHDRMHYLDRIIASAESTVVQK